jgi:hypothetical protein
LLLVVGAVEWIWVAVAVAVVYYLVVSLVLLEHILSLLDEADMVPLLVVEELELMVLVLNQEDINLQYQQLMEQILQFLVLLLLVVELEEVLIFNILQVLLVVLVDLVVVLLGIAMEVLDKVEQELLDRDTMVVKVEDNIIPVVAAELAVKDMIQHIHQMEE